MPVLRSPRGGRAASSVLVLAALLAGFPAPARAAREGLAPAAPATAVTLPLDPQAVVAAESHVVSSVPSAFTGVDIATVVGADRFYANGITGAGETATNLEAGHAWTGHEALGHLTNVDTSARGALQDVDRHATHVTAILGGRSATTRNPVRDGIAYGATLQSASVATAWQNLPAPPYSLAFGVSVASQIGTARDVFPGSAVVNSSFGFTNPGSSGGFAWAQDSVPFANPSTTWVVSAGNSGPAAGTVTSPASGYNKIAVGATGDANAYDGVTSFSSRGPQPYYLGTTQQFLGGLPVERASVDIVAPGHNLTGAYYGGATGGNTGNPAPDGDPNSYLSGIDGTSYAAPIVAGGAALMNAAVAASGLDPAAQAEGRDARVVKAVLLNSADKLAGWDNGQAYDPVDDRIETTQSLDWAQGAGQINLDTTWDHLFAGTSSVAGDGGATNLAAVGWDRGTITAGTSHAYDIALPLEAGSTFVATLTWFRETSANEDLTSASDVRFADLDLQVLDITSGSKSVAASFGFQNNVEHLAFTIPTDGFYRVQVSFFGMELGTAVPTTYGVAWRTIVPEPSSAALALATLVLGRAVLHRRRHRA